MVMQLFRACWSMLDGVFDVVHSLSWSDLLSARSALRTMLRDDFRARIGAAGMGCLLVTHDEAEARVMAARAFHLADGRLTPLW